MRFSTLPAVAAALLTGLAATPAASASGPFVPAGTTPARLTAPGSVDFRFTVVGRSAASFVDFGPSGTDLPADAFSGATSTATVTGVRADGGTVKLTSLAVAAMVPSCRRGGTYESQWGRYRLDIPAGGTATVTVTATVPAGIKGRAAGVEIGSGALVVPGQPSPAIAHISAQNVERDAYVDGLSLKAKKAAGGTHQLTGRIIPARRGAKVTFVSRAASTQERVDSVFGVADQVFGPPAGLRKLGSARTGAGGKFSATLKLKTGVAVAARTGGARAGASCGVLID